MVREEHSAPVQLLQNDQLLTFLQAKLEQVSPSFFTLLLEVCLAVQQGLFSGWD